MKQKEGSEWSTFRPFRSAATEPKSKEQTVSSVSRKDIFLFSLLGFLFGGVIIVALFFLTGPITGGVTLDLLGEKEVTEEASPTTTSTDTVESVGTETVPEEVVVETVVEEEESDPCGLENEITLYLDETYDHNGRPVILKLAGDFAAQISVGGKKELLSTGETMEINGLEVTLVDGSEADATAVITIACE